jgi:hypothetical protein
MKFYNYLNENIDDEDLIETLKDDCSEFLKEGTFLYRGYKRAPSDFFEMTPRKDRRPKDTPPIVQEYIDNYFKHKFGWKPRSSGVFATPDTEEAGQYGNVYFFFPIGKFKYIWNPEVVDLYLELQIFFSRFDISSSDIKTGSESLNYILNKRGVTLDDLLENFGTLYLSKYKNNRLGGNLSSEVMVQCKSYYMLKYTRENYHLLRTELGLS